MNTRGWICTWLVVALASAGCMGDRSTTGTETPDVADDEDATAETPPEEVPLLDEPWTQELYFTSDRSVSTEPQDAGSVAMAGGFSTFLTGAQFTEFLSPPLPGPGQVLPETVRIDLFIHPTAPGVMDPGFTYAAWIGTTSSMPLSQIKASPGVAAPGTVIEEQMVLDWGNRLPVAYLPGDQLRFIIAVNYDGASDAGQVFLLTGGEAASRVEITTQNFTRDPSAGAAVPSAQDFTGVLSNFAPTDCASMEGVNYEDHQVSVAADAVLLRVVSRGSSPGGPADLDIDLYDGTTLLGGGHTATADEGILFAGPALEGLRGKTLTLRVAVCIAVELQYTVTVEQTSLMST